MNHNHTPELEGPDAGPSGGDTGRPVRFGNPDLFLVGSVVCFAFAASLGRFPLMAMGLSPSPMAALPLLLMSGVLPGLGLALTGAVVSLTRWRRLNRSGKIKTVVLAAMALVGGCVG